MSKVEDVARAICELPNAPRAWCDGCGQGTPIVCLGKGSGAQRQAHAAIEAMRWPTSFKPAYDAVFEAYGGENDDRDGQADLARSRALREAPIIWAAMIDAALAEA